MLSVLGYAYLFCSVLAAIAIIICLPVMAYNSFIKKQDKSYSDMEAGVEIPDIIGGYDKFLENLKPDSPYRRQMPNYEEVEITHESDGTAGVEVITELEEKLDEMRNMFGGAIDNG